MVTALRMLEHEHECDARLACSELAFEGQLDALAVGLEGDDEAQAVRSRLQRPHHHAH